VENFIKKEAEAGQRSLKRLGVPQKKGVRTEEGESKPVEQGDLRVKDYEATRGEAVLWGENSDWGSKPPETSWHLDVQALGGRFVVRIGSLCWKQ